MTVDFGFFAPASLGDFVFLDENGNGQQDDMEPGIPGVTVTLTDAMGNPVTDVNGDPVGPVVTGPNGEYLFDDLFPGDYVVTFANPNGDQTPTDQNVGDDATDSDINGAGVTGVVTLESGENEDTVDAGYQNDADVSVEKTFVSAIIQPDGAYNVTYTVTVTNQGGIGSYTLIDTPAFDDDIVINSGNYTGEVAGALLPNAATVLTEENLIAANATETFTLVYNVTLNVSGDANDTDGGDNVYTECGAGGPNGNGEPGQGLYNLVELDEGNDGSIDASDDACGDLPAFNLNKEFVSAVQQADGSYDLSYTVMVSNIGGATGTYTITDTPSFEDDITINSGSASWTTSVGALQIAFDPATGTQTLETNRNLAAGESQTYRIVYNVTLDLSGDAEDTDGGDNVYDACEGGDGEGLTGTPGTGLYNRADLDINNDGEPDLSDDDCGDLPNIELDKEFVSAIAVGDGTYDVTYTIDVTNSGGAQGTYSLQDTPAFDDDVVINSTSNYIGEASGSLSTSGPTTLATDNTIDAGTTETFTLVYNVTLDIEVNSTDGGDNVYTECGGNFSDEGLTGTPGTGLYNRADVDTNGDDVFDNGSDDDCGDLPLFDLELTKVVTSAEPYVQGSTVTYEVAVFNAGDIDATNVEVTDMPQAGLVFQIHYPTNGCHGNRQWQLRGC